MVDLVDSLYNMYKDKSITPEQLTCNLLELMMVMNNEQITRDYSNNDFIDICRKKAVVGDLTAYIFDVQLSDCNISGSITINKKINKGD